MSRTFNSDMVSGPPKFHFLCLASKMQISRGTETRFQGTALSPLTATKTSSLPISKRVSKATSTSLKERARTYDAKQRNWRGSCPIRSQSSDAHRRKNRREKTQIQQQRI